MNTDLIINSNARHSHYTATPETKPSLSNDSFTGLAKPIITLSQSLNAEMQPEDLQHEALDLLQTYLTQCKKAGYHHESCLIAQFILATLCDGKAYQSGLTDNPHLISNALSQSENLRQHFDKAMDMLYNMPAAFVDILELLFICQSIEPNLKLAAGEKNTLYHLIQTTRGEADLRLSKPKKQAKVRSLPDKAKLIMLGSIVGTLVLLGGMLTSFELVINSSQNIIQANVKQLQ